MPCETKFEFILQFEKILGEMKSKKPETYVRNIQFLSIENIEAIRPVLKKFFPNDSSLIDTLVRKDIDLMLMRILRIEIIGLQAEGDKLVKKAKNIVSMFGYFPPVEFFFSYNGAEMYESMIEKLYLILKRQGKPQSLSEIWQKISTPLTSSFELKNIFTKELMFKIRQRLKNYLEKDNRFLIDARTPKKLFISLTEWDSTFNLYEK